MSSRPENTHPQSNHTELATRLREAIKDNEQITTSHQRISPIKQRAPDIVNCLVQEEADHCQDNDAVEPRGVSAPQLAATDHFSVGEDTLRADLKTLTEYGYLDVETSGTTHWYTIADSWTHPETDNNDTASLTESIPTSDTDPTESTHTDTHNPAQTSVNHSNYQHLSAVFTQGAANLTPKQQSVVSIFAASAPIVGILGLVLIVGGQNGNPYFVAAGEDMIRASVTLLIGWFTLTLAGLAEGHTDRQQSV
ncbi:hypothetical protein [Halobacterium salinarum]|uniref:hypothetical protein n=1 Tax=Halobacterium salinarum TaxID=2242 RepID=UPI002554D306|nr:hypothetical protein [Halobacterium salinarum]MDL0135093.1 hypothetical protein [Halobacterium salinarum]